MTQHPFSIFRPFEDQIRIRLYDRGDRVQGNDDLAKREGLPLADAEQPHGSVTGIVQSGGYAASVDGLITNMPGISLTCRGADCQCFVAYAPGVHAGGVLHAGWKGLVAGAIPAFLEKLTKTYGADPADIHIGVGPSLCLPCSEFTDPVTELPGIDRRFFHARLADLRAIADDQLQKSGVLKKHIERHADCTKCDKRRWWSLRGGDKEKLREGYLNAVTFTLLL